MQPRRSAAQRLRMKRKRLVDVEWREDRHKGVRDALGQLLRLGDHAHGCCIPPHWGGWWSLSGSQPSPDLFDRWNKSAWLLPPRFSVPYRTLSPVSNPWVGACALYLGAALCRRVREGLAVRSDRSAVCRVHQPRRPPPSRTTLQNYMWFAIRTFSSQQCEIVCVSARACGGDRTRDTSFIFLSWHVTHPRYR